MKYLYLVAIFILGSCASNTTAADDVPAFDQVKFETAQATEAERKECEAAGGEVSRTGRLGGDFCLQTFPDEYEVCQSGSDCIGFCYLEDDVSDPKPGTPAEGVCQATTDSSGCWTLVEDGKIQATICVD